MCIASALRQFALTDAAAIRSSAALLARAPAVPGIGIAPPQSGHRRFRRRGQGALAKDSSGYVYAWNWADGPKFFTRVGRALPTVLAPGQGDGCSAQILQQVPGLTHLRPYPPGLTHLSSGYRMGRSVVLGRGKAASPTVQPAHPGIEAMCCPVPNPQVSLATLRPRFVNNVQLDCSNDILGEEACLGPKALSLVRETRPAPSGVWSKDPDEMQRIKSSTSSGPWGGAGPPDADLWASPHQWYHLAQGDAFTALE
eukprot:gene4645-846_t